jgi:hypothetical protein
VSLHLEHIADGEREQEDEDRREELLDPARNRDAAGHIGDRIAAIALDPKRQAKARWALLPLESSTITAL